MKHAPTTKNDQDRLLQALATNVRRFRKEKGWSQSDLADHTSVHMTHVNRVETGKYMPALEWVYAAAQALGTSVDVLLSTEENPTADVRIEDKELAERLRLLESLDAPERSALITVIDSMLTKHRMRQVIEGQVQVAG